MSDHHNKVKKKMRTYLRHLTHQPHTNEEKKSLCIFDNNFRNDGERKTKTCDLDERL